MDGGALLSSMVAPVVLINADGLFILSTAQRFGRQVDRLRRLASDADPEEAALTARRARLLHKALAAQYVAMCLFTAAVFSAAASAGAAALLALGGVGALFYSCVLLIVESRTALENVESRAREALGLTPS